MAHILCVPVFMPSARSDPSAGGPLEALGLATLRTLLALQALLLGGAFVLGVSAGAPFDPTAARAVTVGILAVAAMAVQNALVQISLTGGPLNRGHDHQHHALHDGSLCRTAAALPPARWSSARRRVWRAGPVIAGFVVGCGLGAAYGAAYGLWSLVLSAGFAVAAVVHRSGRQHCELVRD